jgi:anti-sigma factor RsiW
MNANRKCWEHYAERARHEPVPPMDVTERIIRSLSPGVVPRTSDWPLWVATAVSVAAAIAVLLTASLSGALFDDPFARWLSPFLVVMQ